MAFLPPSFSSFFSRPFAFSLPPFSAAVPVAAWPAGEGARRRVPRPGQVPQPELLPELVAQELRLAGAQLSVGVGQSPELGDGELRRAQRRRHVRPPQHLLGQLRATSLGEQHPVGEMTWHSGRCGSGKPEVSESNTQWG